jgi:preprotein translocase subunit SecA
MKERKSDQKRVEKKAKAPKAKKAPKDKKPTDKLADKSGLTIFLQHIFGDAQKRTLRRLAKRVEEINKLGAKYSEMDDEELQAQTEKLKSRLKKIQKQDQAKLALAKVKGAKNADKEDKKAAKKAKKEDMGSYEHDDILFVVQAEMDYSEQQAEE